MKDIQKFISPFIEDQFPNHYLQRPGVEITESERAVIVDLVEAFYEHLETYPDTTLYQSRRMFEYRDVDTTLDIFIKYFRYKYLNNIPYDFAVTDELAVKKIIDLYRAKGSQRAAKLLIRLLFNSESEVYLPGKDVLRPSDSEWIEGRYLEVTRTSRNIEYLFTRITGDLSGTTAFVESVITKRINGKLIDILYVSDIKGGEFQTGEFVTNDGNLIGASKITGSLSSIEITESESGYALGQKFEVVSQNGANAIARVTEILNTTDSVEFGLEDAGYGYSVEDSVVLMSTAVLFVDNENLDYIDYESVTQTLSDFSIADSTSVNIDDAVIGKDSSNNALAYGHVVNLDGNTVKVETANGDFTRYQTIELQNANLFIENEPIKEESGITLSVGNVSGTFTNGEEVLQRELINGAYSNIAYGLINNVSGTTLILENAWGEFKNGLTVEGLSSGATGDISNVVVTSNGAFGTITSSSNTTLEVAVDYGEFTANADIRGEISKNINSIANVEYSGVQTINIDGVDYNVLGYSNTSSSGIVVGQIGDRVGLNGNTSPFYYSNNSVNTVTSENGITKEITRIGTGSGAGFEIESLIEDTKETVSINTDRIDGVNVDEVPYLEIVVGTAEKSGIGKIANNVVITDGGSGYTNNDFISFSGGGYLGGDAIISAVATITTDGSGTITSVNVLDPGQGYDELPSYSIPTGVGAVLEFDLDRGYGFPESPYSGFDAIIDDALASQNTVIGEIATLANVNRGTGYDTLVFNKVLNADIANYEILDKTISFTQTLGTFVLGEIITAPSGARGRIKSLSESSMTVRALSFDNRFQTGDTITGSTTSSTAEITQVEKITNEPEMGNNADITSRVVFADGVISKVEIDNSGYGYTNLENVTLKELDSEAIAASGVASVERQGKTEGFWKTKTSHLNDKFLHDNRFYQEYSYQIKTDVSFDRYEDIVKEVIHVAGSELFGETQIKGNVIIEYGLDSLIEENI